MDGTVYLDGKVFDGAVNAINRMRERAKVLFITNNSSKSREDYVDKLTYLGIPVKPDEIYTAGHATIEYIIQNTKFRKIWLLGAHGLKEEFKASGLTIVNGTKLAPELVVVAFDTTLTYKDLAIVCEHIRHGVPFIATHPDFNCPMAGGEYIPDVGSFLALIKASTGKSPALICGKPYAPIAKSVGSLVHLAPNEIAMVGDRLMTDMNFAINNGFKSILVLSGEATRDDLAKSGMKVDAVINSISDINF